jgi:hypothetical protein
VLSPRPTTPGPTPTIDFDRAACDNAPSADNRFRVAAHDDGARTHLPSVEAALAGAVEHAGSVYGWLPTETTCVHVFSSEATFISGLDQFLGISGAYADTFRDNSGTVFFDWDQGRDMILLNTSATQSLARVATHEFMHIVQGYVEHGGSPIWFLEGVAEWEAARVQGERDPAWISEFAALARAGLAPELSQLTHPWEWDGIADAGPAYAKATLAVMYLERAAGANAVPQLLTNENVIEAADFEAALRALTGLGVDELDDQLLPFAEQLAARE